MKHVLILFLLSMLSPFSVKGQYYTGIIRAEFSDSLLNVISPKAVRENHVKAVYAYRICEENDSTLAFKSFYDSTGNKVNDEVFMRNNWHETWFYKDGILEKTMDQNGRIKQYEYEKDNQGLLQKQQISFNQNGKSEVIYCSDFTYSSGSLSSVIVLASAHTTDTVDCKIFVKGAQQIRTKSLQSYAIDGHSRSIYEMVQYNYDASGMLTEIEFTTTRGLSRSSVIRKIHYSKNNLVSSVTEKDGCSFLFFYLFY